MRGCPDRGTVFMTVADGDKPAATGIATVLHELGFRIVATRGTAQSIRRMGIPAEEINKIGEGSPHVVDWIEQRRGRSGRSTRRSAPGPVPTATRSGRPRSPAGSPASPRWPGAMAAARAIAAARRGEPEVVSLQEIHASTRSSVERRGRNAEPQRTLGSRSAAAPRRSPSAQSTAHTSS